MKVLFFENGPLKIDSWKMFSGPFSGSFYVRFFGGLVIATFGDEGRPQPNGAWPSTLRTLEVFRFRVQGVSSPEMGRVAVVSAVSLSRN